MLELAILGLLEEEPLHGYELKKRLDDTVGAVSGVSYGSLYPALRRLEKAGAIEALEPPVEAPPIPATGSIGGETAAARMRRRLTPTRRKRKEYLITAHGQSLLRQQLLSEEGADDGRAFALRLAFCRYLEPEERLTLLERRRAWLADKLGRMKSLLAPASPGEGPGEGRREFADRYTRSLVEHDREATRHEIEWVERLIADERAGVGAKDPARSAPKGGDPS